MNSRFFSWEIVLAGLAFVGIAFYLLDRSDNQRAEMAGIGSHPEAPASPAGNPLPSTIVIDLHNLKGLKNLKDLKNLENLKHLEIEFKNLEKIIREQEEVIRESAETSVEQSLDQIEQSLQDMENTDFNIRLQDRKVFIHRKFDVKEAAWSEVSSGVYVFRESFDLPEDGSVDLNLGFGNINIVGGGNAGGELVLQATGSVDSPKELQKQLKLSFLPGDQKSTFDISQAEGANLSDRINLEATLTLPERSNSHVKTEGGHIKATQLRGSQTLVTSGGHISLDDLSGTCTAKTSGGHITGDRVEGDCTLATDGGHITLSRANGAFNLSTGGGHIEIREFKGKGRIKTRGGNISAAIAAAEGPLMLNSSAGNISLFLPSSINADLELRGTKISVDDAFQFSGSKTNGKMVGILNGGGIPITAGCGYGNVSVKTHD